MKIICNQIEFAHINDFENSESDELTFKNGKGWNKLHPAVKITYNSDEEITDSGTLVHESVTALVYSNIAVVIVNNLKSYILRLYGNNETFIVGSIAYPTQKTINDDKVRATIKFERTSCR